MNKIFITWQSGGMRAGDVIGYALCEDGTNLASHLCSDEYYVPHDMGMGDSIWKHETYDKHYPDGYELVWVGEIEKAIKDIPEFAEAVKLNNSKDS